MLARLSTLAAGILIGYSFAYFHVSVDPDAFIKGNEDRLAASTPSPSPVEPAELPAAAMSLEDELNKFVASREWARVISLGNAGITMHPEFKNALSPIMDNAYANQAKKAFGSKDFETTIKLLKESEQYVMLTGEEYMMLAQSLYELNRFDEARLALTEAEKDSQISSHEVRTLQRKIVSEQLAGTLARKRYEEAIHLLELELISDASYSPYYLRLAELHFKLGNHEKVVGNFESAGQMGEQLNGHQSKLYKSSKRRMSSPNVIEVPLKKQGNSLFVDAVLNSSSPPMHFVVDTGASLTSISPQVADALGVFYENTEVVTLNTANGPVNAPKVVLENLAIAEARVDDVDTVVMANMGDGIDGLLGLSFLQHFDVEISNEEGLLILRPH